MHGWNSDRRQPNITDASLSAQHQLRLLHSLSPAEALIAWPWPAETASTRTHISLAYACVACLLLPALSSGVACSCCVAVAVAAPAPPIDRSPLFYCSLMHAASPLPYLVTTISIMGRPHLVP